MHNPAGSDQHILTMSPHPQENNLAHSTELTRGQSYARQAWVLGPAGGSFFLLGGLLLCLTTSGWDSFTSTLGGSPPTKCHSSLVREICDDNGDYGTNLESRVLLGLCGTLGVHILRGVGDLLVLSPLLFVMGVGVPACLRRRRDTRLADRRAHSRQLHFD
eukprot:TRINITY_DN7684_c0_g1_i3.p1 TRINITY_DN7684_c0_g1~~TRINITY_DN7684_c0_g1_i3.p1  ORF type:complete len:161 (+),score=11.02 TRINITY_DN7684_c0_g1_i3:205-687(+)